MKNPKETAQRWLTQAEHSLRVARLLFDNREWSDTCFQSEQTAQMALKAFLYLKGRRSVRIHSVRELALDCAKEDDEFSSFVALGGVLDRYYLASRYPDAVPAPAVPFETFDDEEASRAFEAAQVIVATVRARVQADP